MYGQHSNGSSHLSAIKYVQHSLGFFVRRFAHPLAQDFVHGSTVGDVGFRHHMRPLFLPVDHESVWWPFHILPIAVRLAAAFSLPVGV